MTTPTTRHLSVHEVRDLTDRDGSVALLDVRTPAEFEGAHIPGSVNIPLDQLDGQLAALAGREAATVLVCKSGGRAQQAHDKLSAAGCLDTSVLEGGVTAWQQAGAPVVRGVQRWDLERQVRLVAGGLVLTFVLASVVVPPLKFLAAAVGAGLVFAALTNSCAMGTMLSKLPYNRGASCDVAGSVARLTRP